MENILEQIEEYLLQNNNTRIGDILVSYDVSLLIRKDKRFTYSSKYLYNDASIIAKECHIGDVTLNKKDYRILCNLTLETDEVIFN